MSNELKNNIQLLLEESSQFNTNDVLVDARSDNKKLCFTKELSLNILDFPKRILSETKKTKKESGINSLCIAHEIIHLELKGKLVETPVFLNALNYSIDKIRETITFSHNEENVFLNPFLVLHLKNSLGISSLTPNAQEKEHVINWLVEIGLNIDNKHPQIIGNFHHHRFQIVKELEELIASNDYSSNIRSLFLGSSIEKEKLSLPKDILLASDSDHLKVFEKVQESNVVIQGPPGTGKSQVLTNLIAKTLASNNTSIVVSEKRVALEVLVKKLSKFGLDKYCFIASSDNLSHSFLQELKSTWDYLENYQNEPINNIRLSEQFQDNLQMSLDLLNQKDLIGGVSYHQFLALSERTKKEDVKPSSIAPEIDHFLANEKTLDLVFNHKINASIGRLKKSFFSADNFKQFDQKINRWTSSISQLEKDLSFATWSDFDSLKKEAVICQVFENDFYKKYTPIYQPNSTAQKKFLSLRKKYLKAKEKLSKIQSNSSHWKINPSESETKSLLEQLERNTFFGRIKTRKRWSEVSTLPFSKAQEELSTRLKETQEINSFSEITIKFCELGIDNPELEIASIYQTLHAYSDFEWKGIADFNEERKSLLTNSHKRINDLHHELKFFFNFKNDDRILHVLQKLRDDWEPIFLLKNQLKNLDQSILFTLSECGSLTTFTNVMLASHLLGLKTQFNRSGFSKIEALKEKVNDTLLEEKKEANLFAKSIENNLHKAFVEYNELLTIPARKLSEELKVKKMRLRKGKSILIKEFSKTRSHPSLRELQNSDAREWIQLLKPIWLSNPTQMAKCFPMQQELFDVAIFDEASQIPLQNSLGTIQRSKRIVVAGDEHQMGPSNYFSTGNSEQIDLLHQANYYWNKVDLKHHYRSLHPDLISFSNQHFYKNELKAFPAFNVSKALHHYFLENGRFIDRKNEQEAKAIAKKVSLALQKNQSIGIVAFSEEQLSCIWKELSSNDQGLLSNKIENNQGFFKALENVQGDECDVLFISFGYAKNEEDEFYMRFGPMSTLNGRKRLNVLLTRARRELHFFCSVQSNDFKLSENESINLLKKWIAFSEQENNREEYNFPFDLHPKIEGNQLTFHAIQEKLSSAIEVKTLQSVLENRGWNVSYS